MCSSLSPVSCSCGSHKSMFWRYWSLSWDSLQLHWPLNNFQKYKCIYVVMNNITKIIKTLKQWAMPSQHVLQQTAKTCERQLGSQPGFVSYGIIKQENSTIYPRLGFLINKMGIIVDPGRVVRTKWNNDCKMLTLAQCLAGSGALINVSCNYYYYYLILCPVPCMHFILQARKKISLVFTGKSYMRSPFSPIHI